MDYSTLVKNAIRKAQTEAKEKYDNATVITEHESGVNTVTTFYKKDKAVWCRMTTGCISHDNRVYKVNTDKPYIREYGRYWYLGEKEIAAMKSVL